MFYSRFFTAFVFAGMMSSVVHSAAAGDWRFPIAISYVSGAQDVADLYEQNIENEIPNSVVDSTGWPIGISFHPYYELDFGLGIGAGIGPIMVIYTDTGSSGAGEYDFTNIPVNLDARFNFLPKKSFTPYLRAGLRKNNASGDFVVDDEIGPFYAVGVEIRSLRRVHFGIEIAKDDSSVEFYNIDQPGGTRSKSNTKKISPIDTMISFYVIF